MVNSNLLDRLPSSMQKKLKKSYYLLYENVPLSLMMAKGYFKVIELMKNPDTFNENSDFIENTQRELLANILKNALLNVPFYRDNVHINPTEIEPANSLEILQEFPLLDKEEIMKHPEDFISEKFNKKTLYYATSGGSTGVGIGVWRTLEELQIERAFFDNMWSKYGYQRKSKTLRMGADAVVPLDMSPFQISGRRLLVSPLHLNEKFMPQIVEKIKDFSPEFIHAYPSCVESLALYLKAHNMSIKVNAIFLASEEVKPEQIELFKEIFGTPICFHYGATEQVLLGYGCYIDNKVVYHLNPLYGIAETLQDENGNHEMIGTSLWNHAMPLIRYHTQDYGVISGVNHECAKCESKWKTVIRLDGRKQNFLVTKQRTLYPECSLSIDKFTWEYIKIFQYVQNTPGELELHVVPNDRYSEDAERKIIAQQKEKLSEWFDVKYVKVNHISRTMSGKRRLVIINHNFCQKR